MNQDFERQTDIEPDSDTTNNEFLLDADEVNRIETKRLLNRRRVAFLEGDTFYDSEKIQLKDADLEDTELNDVVGLAISGGGLRSATFNDGMLTAFSHKGLLRFVDYISAVSGGAYITGNMMCRGKEFSEIEDQKVRSFHDAEIEVQDGEEKTRSVRIADVGVNRVTGKPRAGRLQGAGNYLSPKSSLICVHAVEFLCRALVYLGITGIVATLVALLFRSCDTLQFRHLYFNYLGLGTWGELGIAMLPTWWVIFFCIFITGVVQLTRIDKLLSKSLDIKLPMLRRKLSSTALGFIAFFAIASVAIFLGNGYTSASNGNDSLFELENWAVTLGAIAAVFQILVFLGRDRLLKSESQSASRIQKAVHAVLLTSMTCAAVFFAIYLMGRENISNYVANRGRDLVTGDVANFRKLIELHQATDEDYSHAKIAVKFLSKDDEQSNNFYKSDPWDDFLAKRDSTAQILFEDGKKKDADAYAPLGFRLIKTAWIWWHCINPPTFEEIAANEEIAGQWNRLHSVACKPNTKEAEAFNDDLGKLVGKCLKKGDLESAGGYLKRWVILEEVRNQFLEHFNENVLPTESFHQHLVEAITGHTLYEPNLIESGTIDGEEFTGILPELRTKQDDAIEVVQETMTMWSAQKCQSFVANCIRVLDGKPISMNGYGSVSESEAMKQFSRDCIHVLDPGLLARYGIVSTLVVPEKDQEARVHLLLWSIAITLLGLFISAFSPTATLYQFYKSSIANQFLNVDFFQTTHRGLDTDDGANQEMNDAEKQLTSAKNSKTTIQRSDQPISSFDLTDVGLPIPIINCAEVYIDQKSKEVVASPFAFTPHYVGSEKHGMMPPKSYLPGNHIRQSGSEPDVPIADAICISGAALSSQMSRSLGTRVIMDLFGVDLGRYLAEPRLQYKSRVKSWRGYASKFTNVFARLIGRQDTRTYRHIADGGFTDYLGVMELLKRKCRLIIVSDAGINTSDDELQHLARMLEVAKKEMGIQFFDLDHDAPLNFMRLDRSILKDNDADDAREDAVAPQQFVCMRVRYPDKPDEEAYLIYAQMVICEDDPLEIRQIRQKFPDFPDEPTTNQFFTQQQVDAYHRLGYYIGSLICAEAEPWAANKIVDSVNVECSQKKRLKLKNHDDQNLQTGRFDAARSIIETDRSQPLFSAMLERLLLGYRMACYREKTHSTDDVFSEAIWQDDQTHFPHFSAGVEEIKEHFHMLKGKRNDLDDGRVDSELMKKLIDHWMVIWERNADIRNAYRDAVFQDINLLKRSDFSEIAQMQEHLFEALAEFETSTKLGKYRISTTLHLASMAMACQQFHTGWLGKIFQIGGRKKLIALVAHMAEQICKKEDMTGTPNEQIEIKMRNLCPSLLEMQTCVFREGCQNVVVSFAVCLSVSLNMIKQPNINSLQIDWCSLSDFIAEFDKALESRSRMDMVKSLMLLSDSVRPQFRATSDFLEEANSNSEQENNSDAQGPEDLGQIMV